MRYFLSVVCCLSLTFAGAQKKKDTLKTRQLGEIVFQKKSSGIGKNQDMSAVKISTKNAKAVTSVSGGIESVLKTLPSVNSNTELSSQYMVRGGSYDENLVYINDIEIYRPFLVRNSQQEGLSIINPDMVSALSFSAGGFEPRYGDKMSSALNIYYREPKGFELSGEGSLLGGRLTAGYGSDNNAFSALVSARYRNTNLVLKTLNEETDFNPQYMDLQTYLNYRPTEKLQLSFLGIATQNTFTMLPKAKDIDFGSLQNPYRVTIGYAGREDDRYRTLMGTLSAVYNSTDKLRIIWDNFAYQNREKEYYTIASSYAMQATDPVSGNPYATSDLSGQIENARNDVNVKVIGSQLRARYELNPNTNIEAGIKYEKEMLHDLTNEWRVVDSAGYSFPRNAVIGNRLDDGPLLLNYAISGSNKIQPVRFSGYVQAAHKFLWNTSKVSLNGGVRLSRWSFNNETLLSPRVQFALKPDWKADMLFRVAGGVYYQAPFYKEIKDLTGAFNSSIQAQRSWQVILGNDYEFRFDNRPFKLTTELYYKKMDRLIPYFMDNVRVRYSGKNNAEGYAYGVDTRLYGEFVPGVDSWLSASYARVFENIDGKGYIPRPTDQRFRFSMFYQDYMPRFPKMRVNLTAVYAMGLPNGAPLFNDPYAFQKTLPSYKRVDIGLSYVFIDPAEKNSYYGFLEYFDELALSVQVFNAFNINNTIANQWISDVSTGNILPVPVRLTGRFFNVKLDFKL